MSRVAIASFVFVTAVLSWLPMPTQNPLPYPITLHGHPRTVSYASDAALPLASAQTHWNDPPPGHTEHDHHLAHTHVELWAPFYGELPRHGGLYDLRGRIQVFHLAGRVSTSSVFCDLGDIIWADTSPIEGNPDGVVLREFTLRLDLNRSFNNGSGGAPFTVPENGWFPVVITAYTNFDRTGAVSATELWAPFYAKGDPAVPEWTDFFNTAGFYFVLSARASMGGPHGTAISEYRDSYVPVAALASTLTAPGLAYAYARREDLFPAPELDAWKQVDDADLHNGVPGITRTLIQPATGGRTEDVVFDPGVGKVALVWEQHTGTVGNTDFPAHQQLNSLLVVNIPGGPVDPPPTPGDPVDCAGSYGPWVQVNAGLWRREFTVTQQPANGGKSCAVVVNGG